MVNIIVCDDEAVFLDIASEGIDKIMSKLGIKYNCLRFRKSSDFAKLIDKGEVIPHIVFLDIDMPEINGKQIAVRLKKAYPLCQLIFFTSHEEELQSAFDYNANGFLSKYKLSEKFEENILRVLEIINAGKPDHVRLCMFTDNGFCEYANYSFSDIVYMEYSMKKAYLNTADGACRRVKCGLWRDLLRELDKPPFVVPHQNYIVNMSFISRISGDELFIDLLGKCVSISKYRRRGFMKRYSEFSMFKGRIT